MFYAATEMPGARTLQGVEGIKEVYRETLNAKSDIYLLRTTSDEGSVGIDFLNRYRRDRAKLGINTYALTPDVPIARINRAREDVKMLFHRTMMPVNAYTAPVEIDVFGNKTALISFGKTEMAVIIDSPPVAEAMRQVLQILTEHFSE
jgi:hypothetical protein